MKRLRAFACRKCLRSHGVEDAQLRRLTDTESVVVRTHITSQDFGLCPSAALIHHIEVTLQAGTASEPRSHFKHSSFKILGEPHSHHTICMLCEHAHQRLISQDAALLQEHKDCHCLKTILAMTRGTGHGCHYCMITDGSHEQGKQVVTYGQATITHEWDNKVWCMGPTRSGAWGLHGLVHGAS
eukprot:390513-Pelagomonas_calceolata.AAC.1